MATLMKNDLMEAQLKRALGYTAYGGADIGECLSTADRIRGTDLDQWHDEWRATADRVRELAEASRAGGHRQSARAAFFRASNYYRTAWVMLMGAPVDPRLVAAHASEVDCFRAGAELLDRPPELLEIPCGELALPGYLFRASGDGGSRPILILTNGYDGTAEELYFTNGLAALERGYDVLTFDGPGQGSMLIDEGVPLRPDWESVITPVVDFLHARGEDQSPIALMGLSLGGYLAPRAATEEHRLAACISDCGPYDLFDATAAHLPGPLASQLPDGNRAALAILEKAATSVMYKPTAGWSLRRNLMAHGIEHPLEYFREAPKYTLKGLEPEIRCPTFVCNTDADELGSAAPTLFEGLTCAEKEYVEFKAADGAGDHCEGVARVAFHQQALDWLDTVIGTAKGK